MTTVSTSAGITSLPPSQGQMDRGRCDPHAGLLSYGHQLSHCGHYQEQVTISGRSLSQFDRQAMSGRVGNAAASKSDAVIKADPVRISSPDYNTMALRVGLGEVKRNSVSDTVVDVINGQRIKHETHDANSVGRGGTLGGGSCSGEGSRSPSPDECYKSGNGDTTRIIDSDSRCNSGSRQAAATRVTARGTDAEDNNMGNDLFRARTASVSDARANLHDGGNVRGTTDKIKSKQDISETHQKSFLTHANCDKPNTSIHSDDDRKVLSNEPCSVSVTSENSETQRAGNMVTIHRDLVGLDSLPVTSGYKTGTDIGIPNISIVCNTSECLSTREETSQRISSSEMTRTFSESAQNSNFSPRPCQGQGGSSSDTSDKKLPQKHCIGYPKPDECHQTSSSTNSYKKSSNHSTSSTTHIPLLDVSSKDIPNIYLIPSTPEVISLSPPLPKPGPDGTTSAQSSGITRKETDTNEIESSKEVVNSKTRADRKKINGTEKSSTSEATKHPAGGVKVLPSTFTFNFRNFRESKKTSKFVSHGQSNSVASPRPSTGQSNSATSPPLSTGQSNAVASPQPSPGQSNSAALPHPREQVSHAKCDRENPEHKALNKTQNASTLAAKSLSLSSSSSDTITAITSFPGKSISPLTSETSTISSNVHHEKELKNQHISSTRNSENAITPAAEPATWGDYAVPSDVLIGPSYSSTSQASGQASGASSLKENISPYYSTEIFSAKYTSFTDKDSFSEPHYKVIPSRNGHSETFRLETINNSEADKHTNSGPNTVSAGHYTEEDYAVPIPKAQRPVQTPNSGVYAKVLPGNQFVSAELPQKPPQYLTKSSIKSQYPDDVFDDVLLRNKVLKASFMKKSTTTGTLHAYSGDHTSFPDTTTHNLSYDYFSLGRRPKRPKVTLSLDMLLRSKRESLTDITKTTAAPEQTLSVDDILNTCKEFEENIATQRLVTSSDNIIFSPTQPMSFTEASNIQFPDPPPKRRATHRNHSMPTKSRPNLKKSQSVGARSEIGKRDVESRRDYSVVEPIKDIRHNTATQPGQIVSKGNEKMETPHGNNHGEGNLPLSTFSAFPSTNRDKGNQPLSTSTTTPSTKRDKELAQFAKINEKQSAISESTLKTESRKPDNVQSYCFMDIGRTAENQMTNTVLANKLHQNVTEQPKAFSSQGDQDLDYDQPQDSLISVHQKTKTEDPSDDSLRDMSELQVKRNIHTSTMDSLTLTKPLGESLLESKTAVYIPQPNQQCEAEVQKSKSPPATIVSPTQTKTDPQTSSSNLSPPTAGTQDADSCHGNDISSTSDFETKPPLSVIIVPSEPANSSQSGIMASLSLDVSYPGPGDSPSPNQRSPNYFSKLEAVEALKWLRAAGFPQYAQMFEDGQFPVELCVVERDHDFLDKDSLKSLFRRLETLNKYAGIKLDAHPCKKAISEEDDEDDLCALSERWEYQKSVRRWSRKDLSPSPQKTVATETDLGPLAARSGSHDSLLADQDSGSQTEDSPLLESKMPHQTEGAGVPSEAAPSSRGGQALAEDTAEGQEGSAATSPNLKRAASERMKTAKNIFKKMEGLKSKKPRRQPTHQNAVEISEPVVADRENMQAKLERLNCVDISSNSKALSSPPGTSVKTSSSGIYSDSDDHRTFSDTSISPTLSSPPSSNSPRPHSDFVSRPKDISEPLSPRFASVSQSHASQRTHAPTSALTHNSSFDEYHAQAALFHNLQSGVSRTNNNNDTNLMEIFLVPQDHQPGRFPRMLQNGYIETEACGTAVNARTGSVRLGRSTGLVSDHSQGNPDVTQTTRPRGFGYRVSVYDNFSLTDGKKSEDGGVPITIPSVCALSSPSSDRSTAESSASGSVEISKIGYRLDGNSDCVTRESSSANSSLTRSTDTSDPDQKASIHDRNVSFESSSSSQTPREGTPASDAGITSTDSKDSRISSPDSLSSKSRGVTHSSSLDSYFRGSSEATGSDNSESTSTSTLQQNVDEFDRILQQLYENINDLTTFIGRERQETPRSQTATTGEAVDFYGGLDIDNENSSSAGESSNTAESGSEDQEVALTDLSHDDSLDQIPEVSRERRDSGVGHSLTRAPSDRRRKKIRWHSFQKCHRPDVSSRAMQVNSLSIGQLVRLQKLSLLRLTGIMEKCLPVNKSGWNWMMPRFMKRNKVPDFSDKNVFGVPFSVMAQRTGQPLPQCVLYAMRYLRRTCHNAVGIFRKSGVKSKIQQLRDYLESHPDTTDFEGVNAYNVADMLKTYFRDLPECLLTNKMSETFRSIYTHVPQPQRLEAIQAAILLLPDENREVLQSILLFLSDISSHEADHQMNASNLAVCFTPTVFQLGPRQVLPYSPKRNRKNSSGIPDPREIMEQKAAHECLLMMITECKKLFTVPPNLFRQLQVQSLAHMEPTPLQDISSSPSDVRAFGQERIQMVLKEAHDKNRGWIPTVTTTDVEVFHRKPMDDCPLKEWKLIIDIEAPPVEVLRRIMHERHTWDEDLLSWSVVERLDQHSDIFMYVLNSMAPHPSRNYCVLRYWRSDLNKGACALITMSVEHSEDMEIQGVWAVDLGSYFLMEPCGSGRTRLTYIIRVDTKGRTPEWYTKIFGHICANFLERLRDSFKQDTSGPETKV